jgi:hypothetical protein
MKTKNVATQNAGKLKFILQHVTNWGTVLIMSVLLILISCSKNDDLETIINDSPIDNNTPNNNEVPNSSSGINVGAGTDKLVFLPNRSCTLYGWTSYQTTNPPVKYKWDKIAGPSSFNFVSPDSLSTTLNELEKGVYEFEVTCTAANGYVAKDTCSVIVGQLSSPSSFIVFNNQKWSGDGLLWGSQIFIPDIYQYIPIGSVFKVYIRRENSETWEEIMFDDYNSLIFASSLNGNLGVYSNGNEIDSPYIKIEY